MRRFIHVFLLTSLITLSIFAQLSMDDLPEAPPNALVLYQNLATQLKRIQPVKNMPVNPTPSPGDLVVGQSDPNEVVTITGNFYQDGDIFIVNNGTLNLDSADFQLKGDIFIMGTGTMNITGGRLTIIQDYTYEHQALVLENGSLNFDGVDFQSSGQSWGFTALDSARLILRNSQVSDGFITHGYFGQATARIENTQLPGEFLCFGNNDLQFRNNDWLLFWTVLFDSSTIDISLPDDSLLTGWVLNDSLPNISGIPYSVSIDSCTNVNWGLISQSGSDGTFHNTQFRAIGLMFNQPDSITVENITNGSHHVDDIVAVPDRNLHLLNTDVETWNFYPSASSNITVQNCVFGELLGLDSSQVQIFNSLCDGSGGYLGVQGTSEVLVFQSLISTQVIAIENGFMIGLYSAFSGTEIVSSDFSIMLLLNTLRFVEPLATDGAAIFDGFMPPVEGYTESLVPITGTAQIIAGPGSPLQLTGYSVEYSEAQNPLWQPIDGFHPNPVIDDTLTIWNTDSLSPGAYLLKLNLFHNFGDSISLQSSAYLQEQLTGISGKGSDDLPDHFALEQNYPNPFNPTTAISYRLASNSSVNLSVYNLLGQRIRELVNDNQPAGTYTVKWDGTDDAGVPVAGGVYFYRLSAIPIAKASKGGVLTLKMVLLR